MLVLTWLGGVHSTSLAQVNSISPPNQSLPPLPPNIQHPVNGPKCLSPRKGLSNPIMTAADLGCPAFAAVLSCAVQNMGKHRHIAVSSTKQSQTNQIRGLNEFLLLG